MRTSLTSLRIMLLLLGLAVTATACVPFVGNGPDEETPTPEVIPTIIRPTQETSVTPATSPVPTLVPLPTRAPQATSAPPSCTPRTDWPEYTVQAGDTLYSIALRSDSTQATLQAANCLSDPNKIFEGQSLRVPKQPEPRAATPTAAPAATQPPFFQGTPQPEGTGDASFVVVVAQDSAHLIADDTYQATTADGTVYLSIVAYNAARLILVRNDGREFRTADAPSGGKNAGSMFALQKIDRAAGVDKLIFTARATKTDGTTVEYQNPITIQWP